MPSHELRPTPPTRETGGTLTDFDQAYLTNPEFRTGADEAWRRYQHTGGRRTLGEALGGYQQDITQLMADHRSGMTEGPRHPAKDLGDQPGNHES